MARDLLRGEPTRDQPEDLDLAIGQREAGARALQEDAARDGPADERTEREPCRSAEIHG